VYEKDKHELSLNGIFSHTKDSRPSTYQIDDLLAYTSTGNEQPEFVRLQMDYLYTFANQGQLESGIQFFSRWNKTRYHLHDKKKNPDNWLSSLNPNYGLNHKEYIYTAHLSYSQQQGESWHYKIGVLADYDVTHTKLVEATDKHNSDRLYFYPHLTLRYTPSDQQELAFHFTRKATLPDYTQLNPFTSPIDHQTFEQGNPLLRPEVTNRAEINYLLSKAKLQLNGNLYFNSTERFITPITLFSEDNTLTLSYANGSMENKVGLDINLSGTPSSWMTINPSISLVHTHANGKYQGINLHVDDFSWSGNLELNLNSKKHTEFQALFSYQSPTKVPQFKIEENYYLDLAIKQGFFNNRLQVSFSVSDVFDTSEWQAHSNTDTYRLANYSKEATHAYWIGLTFNFNNFKSRPSADDSHPQKRQVIQLGQ
jgi:possible tonB-dependent receptor